MNGKAVFSLLVFLVCLTLVLLLGDWEGTLTSPRMMWRRRDLREDVFITVKTSGSMHSTRVQLILDTWFNDVYPGNIFIITGQEDEKYSEKTKGALVVTKCGDKHSTYQLCCKTGIEFDTYMNNSSSKWWCHFDDDNYVNVKLLSQLLHGYNDQDSIYIGRKSRDKNSAPYKGKEIMFQFGTGGAGYCITRRLANNIMEWAGNGKFEATCASIGAEDDCTMGYVINGIAGVPLTESYLLHSHQEQLGRLPGDTLAQQVSLSYRGENRVQISPQLPTFNVTEDPTRILSVHCLVKRDAPICTKITPSNVTTSR